MNRTVASVENPQKSSVNHETKPGSRSKTPVSSEGYLAGLAASVNRSPLVQAQLKLREDINHCAVKINVSEDAAQPRESPSAQSLVQRAKADVSYQIDGGAPTLRAGQAVGRGGVGGVSHSEQHIWGQVEGTVVGALRSGRPVKVNFIVDTTICHLCTPWFEGTVWTALNNAAQHSGTNFELKVTVNGRSVVVNGGNTLWPPEIADAPTFGRLTNFGRFQTFFNEKRDKQGKLLGGDFSGHVSTQGQSLLDLVNNYHQVDGSDIEAALAAGRNKAIESQAVQYNLSGQEENDEEVTKEKMHEDMDGIEVYQVVASGRFNTPEPDLRGGHAPGFQQWLIELQTVFQAWMEEYIQDHDDPDDWEEKRVRSAY